VPESTCVKAWRHQSLACLGNEDVGVYGASDGAICCAGSVAGDGWN